MKSLIALDFVFTAFEGRLSQCAQEKNNDFLLDVSYNLLLVLFCLITLFESAERDSKKYWQICLFLVTYSKTWNQLIYIDQIILACVIILGFTIDHKDLWLMLYTNDIVNRRYFDDKITQEDKLFLIKNSTSKETHRVSFGSDEVLPSCSCYDWEKI